MATNFALINKETLNFICNGKGVTIDFLAQKSKYSTEMPKPQDVNASFGASMHLLLPACIYQII